MGAPVSAWTEWSLKIKITITITIIDWLSVKKTDGGPVSAWTEWSLKITTPTALLINIGWETFVKGCLI